MVRVRGQAGWGMYDGRKKGVKKNTGWQETVKGEELPRSGALGWW